VYFVARIFGDDRGPLIMCLHLSRFRDFEHACADMFLQCGYLLLAYSFGYRLNFLFNYVVLCVPCTRVWMCLCLTDCALMHFMCVCLCVYYNTVYVCVLVNGLYVCCPYYCKILQTVVSVAVIVNVVFISLCTTHDETVCYDLEKLSLLWIMRETIVQRFRTVPQRGKSSFSFLI